jgi:hypothetical protein
MISALTRRANKTASQNMEREAKKKTVRINDRAGTWCRITKSCQQIGLVKYYTLYGCVWYLFYRAGHVFCARSLFWSIRRRNLPCNAEDNLCAGHIVIEAWFRGY